MTPWGWGVGPPSPIYSETGLPQGRSPALRHPPTCPVASQASGDCFLVWVFITDQSGMGDPTSSYATACIAPWLIRPRKPHHQRQGHAILRWGPTVLKFGSLNLLDHSGPFQSCNGIALPLCDNMEKYGVNRQATGDNTILNTRIACWIPNTQNMQDLLLFYYNNDCTNAPQCYVIRTLAVLLH
jgi:hypothetical protein